MRKKRITFLALLLSASITFSLPAQVFAASGLQTDSASLAQAALQTDSASLAQIALQTDAASTQTASQTGTTTTSQTSTEQATETQQVAETQQATQTAVSEKKAVTVKGLNLTKTKAVSSSALIKDLIKVAPVHKCTVKLQYYSASSAKWKTVSKYSVSEDGDGKVILKYPSTWKKTETSKWRVYIPASAGYKKYVSETIVITSTRPKNANLSLGARSAVIIRASDAYVIYGKNKDMRVANASTTKMMTALLTIEKGSLDSVTTISSKAASTGWGCLYASAGTKFRVRDLLRVMLVHSSNDAASCLAEWNAGSISKFAAKMNKRAKQLGCKNTHFVNPHGLDSSKHYSSAYDLALIQRECIKHSAYLNTVKRTSYSFSTVSSPKTSYTFYSTDALLGTISGFKGGKTGYTENAGLCFCGIYEYNGVTYLFSVLGNPTSAGRWEDCRKIMKFIRTNYK